LNIIIGIKMTLVTKAKRLRVILLYCRLIGLEKFYCWALDMLSEIPQTSFEIILGTNIQIYYTMR